MSKEEKNNTKLELLSDVAVLYDYVKDSTNLKEKEQDDLLILESWIFVYSIAATLRTSAIVYREY